VKPIDRPDYKFWMTHWSQRTRVSGGELARLMSELEVYSGVRFTLGKRFKLIRVYNSIPIGTRCTVISTWPKTAVRWDKWSQTGYGSRRLTNDVLFQLDTCLDYACHV